MENASICCGRLFDSDPKPLARPINIIFLIFLEKFIYEYIHKRQYKEIYSINYMIQIVQT